MLLTLDISNTSIKAGVFSGETLVANWRVATERQKLAVLPSMLVRRVAVLRAAQPELETSGDADWPFKGWRQSLWAELQQVLQAELDLRLQPLMGLLEALHPDWEAVPAAPAPAPAPFPSR